MGCFLPLLIPAPPQTSSFPHAPLPFLRQCLKQPRLTLNLSACFHLSGPEIISNIPYSFHPPVPTPIPSLYNTMDQTFLYSSVLFQLENRSVKSIGVLNSLKVPQLVLQGKGLRMRIEKVRSDEGGVLES